MANYDFSLDLPIAKKTEKEVAHMLEVMFNAKILDYEDTYKYDILAEIKGKKRTFEIKEDFICATTGNVGLEFECRGKPSGISISEADFYIYKLHTRNYGIKYVLLDTEDLKQMIKDKKYFRIVNGGDEGSNSMNYLFRYNVFTEGQYMLPVEKFKGRL